MLKIATLNEKQKSRSVLSGINYRLKIVRTVLGNIEHSRIHDKRNDRIRIKSRKAPFPVIPAQAGIQSYQMVPACLDSNFRGVTTFYEIIDL